MSLSADLARYQEPMSVLSVRYRRAECNRQIGGAGHFLSCFLCGDTQLNKVEGFVHDGLRVGSWINTCHCGVAREKFPSRCAYVNIVSAQRDIRNSSTPGLWGCCGVPLARALSVLRSEGAIAMNATTLRRKGVGVRIAT